MKNRPETRSGGTPFFWGLARRAILFYPRRSILLCAVCAAGAAILIGAPLVDSSLKGSVREYHTQRLGNVKWALSGADGLFRASIADSIAAYLGAKAAPAQFLAGTASVTGDDSGAASVNVVGVDERFWELGPRAAAQRDISASFHSGTGDVSAVVNSALAEILGIEPGGGITLRFQTAAPDAPTGPQDSRAALRLSVESIADGGKFGNFSLTAGQPAVYNVFVPLKLLQSVNNTPGMAGAVLIDNMAGRLRNKQPALYNKTDNAENGLPDKQTALYTDNTPTANLSESDKAAYENIIRAAQKSLSVKDAGLNLRTVESDGGADTAQADAERNNYIEVYSDRVFISDTLAGLILRAVPGAVPVSAWFVNEIKAASGLSAPYSFVSTPPIDYTLSGSRIALSAWAARDLAVSVGDSVTLAYFVPRPAGLHLDSAVFAVSTILHDTVPWLDKTLAPPYPGLADAGSLIDWNQPIPVDLKKIRHEDENYWEKYRGTPKAVISYDKAAQIWANRLGVCTAIRIPNNIRADNNSAGAVEAAIASSLTPSICGIRLTDARAGIDRAENNKNAFAPLIWAMSLLTFAASLLIIGLLSTLHFRLSAEEHTFLKAVGYSRKHILLVYISEGLPLFAAGTLAGILISPLYALTLIAALRPVLAAAAAAPVLSLHVEVLPVLFGGAAAFACALAAMLIPVFIEARRG